jgi:hypothetical protein
VIVVVVIWVRLLRAVGTTSPDLPARVSFFVITGQNGSDWVLTGEPQTTLPIVRMIRTGPSRYRGQWHRHDEHRARHRLTSLAFE